MTTLTRHNLLTNPSFESALTGWTATSNPRQPTLSQSTTFVWPGAGNFSMKMVWANGASGGQSAQISFTTTIGLQYTVSAWVYIPTGGPIVAIKTNVGSTQGISSAFDQWTRISATITATGTTTTLLIGTPTLLATLNNTMLTYVDGVIAEQTNILYPYFDGDSVGASWDGTPDLSTSTFTAFFTDASLPLTVVEFDASPRQDGDFILDVSKLDGNAFTGDTTTFTASIGTWANSTNTTLARSTAQFHTTPSSLGLTSIASGTMEIKHCLDANIASQGITVIPGGTVTVSGFVRAAASSRSWQFGVAFYDASVTLLTTTFGTSFADSTSTFATTAKNTFTVPGGATKAVMHAKVLSTGGASEVHYLDDVTIIADGQDVLVDSPRYVQPQTYGDIVMQVTIDRGRDDPNGDIQVGNATVYCDNWTGHMDPENAASPFNDDPRLGLVKGMLLRVSVLFQAGGLYIAETVYTGRLQNVTLREGLQPDATLTFADDMALLGNTVMPMYDNSIRAGESGLSRLNWLYYNVGYLDQLTGHTANFSGEVTKAIVPTYGGGSILDEMVDVTAAHAGRAFVNKVGVFTVLSHDDLVSETPIGTLSDNIAVPGIEYSDVQTSSGTMQIVNACRAHVYTQPSVYFPEKFFADLDSVNRYGQNQFNGTVGYRAPLFEQGDLLAIAQYIATRFSRPLTRYDSVTVDFAGNGPAAALLTAEIGQQITVSRTMPYLSGASPYTLTCVIEGIKFTITDQSFLMEFITTPTDSAALFSGAAIFTLNSSLLDGTDVLSAF